MFDLEAWAALSTSSMT